MLYSITHVIFILSIHVCVSVGRCTELWISSFQIWRVDICLYTYAFKLLN